MAYRLDIGIDPDEGLYLEIVVVNRNNGAYLRGDGVDHQLRIYSDGCGYGGDDYGEPLNAGQILASNSNGLILTPAPGVSAINVPPDAFAAYANTGFESFWSSGMRPEPLRFKFLAVPIPTDFNEDFAFPFSGTSVLTPKVLIKGTIAIGGRMASRLTLEALPLYPNSPTANAIIIGTVQVAQVKQQLFRINELDAVEAALSGPTDPATISWTAGGPVSLGGPLLNVVAGVLGLAPTGPQMADFITNASQIPL